MTSSSWDIVTANARDIGGYGGVLGVDRLANGRVVDNHCVRNGHNATTVSSPRALNVLVAMTAVLFHSEGVSL